MPDDSGEAIDQLIDTEGLPEFYADGYRFAATPYTVNLIFTIASGRGISRNLVTVRMSPGHAKMMAILFKRNVQELEKRFGIEMSIPPNLLENHNIDLDRDWREQAEQ